VNIDDLVFELRQAAIMCHVMDQQHTADWADCDYASCAKVKTMLEQYDSNESTARFVTSEEAERTSANSGGICPKCGGSIPTCCRCPEPFTTPPVPVTEPQKRRSNHFSDEAIDRGGFPDHISRDGKAFYRDDTPAVPVAEGGERLLPCPFCGAHAHLEQTRKPDSYGPGGYWTVSCIVCDATIDYHCHDQQEAVDKWNTRAIPSPVDPLEFWADLAEVLGHDRGEVNPASLVTEVSNRLVTRSPVDAEQQARETKDEGVQ
jgi:Lar family restriction alleviation protein